MGTSLADTSSDPEVRTSRSGGMSTYSVLLAACGPRLQHSRERGARVQRLQKSLQESITPLINNMYVLLLVQPCVSVRTSLWSTSRIQATYLIGAGRYQFIDNRVTIGGDNREHIEIHMVISVTITRAWCRMRSNKNKRRGQSRGSLGPAHLET